MTSQLIFQFIVGHADNTDDVGMPFYGLDDDYVSKRHAKVTLYFDERRVTIEDLGTTNGTWLNGVRIYGEREVHPGDKLKIGHTIVPIPDLTDHQPEQTPEQPKGPEQWASTTTTRTTSDSRQSATPATPAPSTGTSTR